MLCVAILLGRRGGLIVNALVYGSSGLGSSPGWGYCAVLVGKIIYFHGSSPNKDIQMGNGKFNAGDNTVMDRHLIKGE